MAEFIYTMIKARKTVGDKVILDDVTMSFFPGAKIGMVGPNGAGKSTILKIMAGLDTPSNGEATLSAGYSVGILMQEPELDESKTVLENVQDGVRAMYDKLERFNAISLQMSEPDADFDALLAEMGNFRKRSTTRTPGILTRNSNRRWTRCGARRRTPRSVSFLVEKSVALRSANCSLKSPTFSC